MFNWYITKSLQCRNPSMLLSPDTHVLLGHTGLQVFLEIYHQQVFTMGFGYTHVYLLMRIYVHITLATIFQLCSRAVHVQEL